MRDTQYVLIRIDDIARRLPNKDRLISNLCRSGAKVSCSVIPALLETRCIQFLEEIARDYPGCLEINQHGWSHRNYSRSELEYEFGADRTYEQQLEDILNGKRRLDEAFGDIFIHVFTPPFASYDETTLLALKAAGFQAISGGVVDAGISILPNLCPDVDCFEWHPTRPRTWESVAAELAGRGKGRLRGLILHPALMRDEDIDFYSLQIPQLIDSRLTVHFRHLLRQSARRAPPAA